MTFPPPQVPPPLPRAAQSAPRKPRARRNNYRQPGSKPTVTNAVISINVGIYLWMSLSGFDKTSINFVISRQFLEAELDDAAEDEMFEGSQNVKRLQSDLGYMANLK